MARSTLDGIDLYDARPGDVIGTRKDGRPIFLLAGGAPDDAGGGLLEEESQRGGSGDGGDGGDGGTGGDGGDQGGDGGSGDGDQGGDGGGDGQTVDVDAIVARLEERLASRFDSIADRRVNAILREVRGRGGQGGGGNDGGGGGGQGSGSDGGGDSGGDGNGQQQERQGGGGVDPALVRDVRSAYRDYVGDRIQFLSAEERAFASDLANWLGGEALVGAGRNADTDRIGRQVAEDVATRLRALRKHYEDRTVGALRRRGALKDSDGSQQGGGATRPGQPPAGGARRPGDSSTFAKGQEKAAAMFANRQPAQSGS